MEWLFGRSTAPPPEATVNATLSYSTAQGRSAPSQQDASYHKNRGNEHFKRKEFENAVREYTLGIEQGATATLFSNRSVGGLAFIGIVAEMHCLWGMPMDSLVAVYAFPIGCVLRSGPIRGGVQGRG